MAENAPTPRVDNAALQDAERAVTEGVLYIMADWIDALAKSGAVYPQIVLSPEEAAQKLAATRGGA